jgi:hypothetical protein
MKTLLWMAMAICLSSNLCFSQVNFSPVNFSDETKKYIDYNDPVIVFKNALMIDGEGSPAKPYQTVRRLHASRSYKIATLNGAIAQGFDKKIGTIEPGKSADLLIIDGDPSKNIGDIRKVQYVFRNGVGYNSKKLFDSVKGKVGFI